MLSALGIFDGIHDEEDDILDKVSPHHIDPYADHCSSRFHVNSNGIEFVALADSGSGATLLSTPSWKRLTSQGLFCGPLQR